MSNPLESVRVPVANGSLRSGGKDLIRGETVEAFWSWPAHIQKLQLDKGAVIWLPAADAAKVNAQAAEIREAASTKRKVSALKGKEAELRGLIKLDRELEKQHYQIQEKIELLGKELKAEGADLDALLADAYRRPEDDESDAVNAQFQSDVHQATGIKNPKPDPEPDANADGEDDDDDEGEGDGEEGDAPRVETSDDEGEPAGMEAPLVNDVIIAKLKQWAHAFTYKELQKEANNLDVKAVGVSHKVLEPMVVDAAIIATEIKMKAAAEEEKAAQAAAEADESTGADE